jgi:Asp-tRNA(Asn)/Glu-tRNA(Gln) amidotransferase A subunit family amidase
MQAVEARLPSELWRWPARDLARGIRLRRISSREVVESCLQRIDKVNPVLNALVEVSREEALARADASDRAVAAGDVLGTLHGVPTSIKVNSDEAGHATTNGIVALREANRRGRRASRAEAARRRRGIRWAEQHTGVLFSLDRSRNCLPRRPAARTTVTS